MDRPKDLGTWTRTDNWSSKNCFSFNYFFLLSWKYITKLLCQHGLILVWCEEKSRFPWSETAFGYVLRRKTQMWKSRGTVPLICSGFFMDENTIWRLYCVHTYLCTYLHASSYISITIVTQYRKFSHTNMSPVKAKDNIAMFSYPFFRPQPFIALTKATC